MNTTESDPPAVEPVAPADQWAIVSRIKGLIGDQETKQNRLTVLIDRGTDEKDVPCVWVFGVRGPCVWVFGTGVLVDGADDPYMQGRVARAKGEVADACPYDFNDASQDDDRLDWLEGWREEPVLVLDTEPAEAPAQEGGAE